MQKGDPIVMLKGQLSFTKLDYDRTGGKGIRKVTYDRNGDELVIGKISPKTITFTYGEQPGYGVCRIKKSAFGVPVITNESEHLCRFHITSLKADEEEATKKLNQAMDDYLAELECILSRRLEMVRNLINVK